MRSRMALTRPLRRAVTWRCRPSTTRPCHRTAPLALLPLVVAAALAMGAAEVDGPLPRLGDVGPVDGVPDGLSISPAVVEVELQPGRRREVRHVVANTTAEPVTLVLTADPVTVGPAGPARAGPVGGGPTDRPPGDDAPPLASGPADGPARLVLPLDELHLAPGQGAELVSTAEATTGGSEVVAVRATTATGDSVRSLVVLRDAASPASPAVAIHLADDPDDDPDDAGNTDDTAGVAPATPGFAAIEVAVERHAVVDVRLRVHGWSGILTDTTYADLVVGPDAPRVIPVDRPAGAPPGRLEVEVVATDRSGTEARAEVTTAFVLGGPLVWAAVLAIVVAGAAVAVTLRRSRRHEPRLQSAPRAPADPEEPSP